MFIKVVHLAILAVVIIAVLSLVSTVYSAATRHKTKAKVSKTADKTLHDALHSPDGILNIGLIPKHLHAFRFVQGDPEQATAYPNRKSVEGVVSWTLGDVVKLVDQLEWPEASAAALKHALTTSDTEEIPVATKRFLSTLLVLHSEGGWVMPYGSQPAKYPLYMAAYNPNNRGFMAGCLFEGECEDGITSANDVDTEDMTQWAAAWAKTKVWAESAWSHASEHMRSWWERASDRIHIRSDAMGFSAGHQFLYAVLDAYTKLLVQRREIQAGHDSNGGRAHIGPLMSPQKCIEFVVHHNDTGEAHAASNTHGGNATASSGAKPPSTVFKGMRSISKETGTLFFEDL